MGCADILIWGKREGDTSVEEERGLQLFLIHVKKWWKVGDGMGERGEVVWASLDMAPKQEKGFMIH